MKAERDRAITQAYIEQRNAAQAYNLANQARLNADRTGVTGPLTPSQIAQVQAQAQAVQAQLQLQNRAAVAMGRGMVMPNGLGPNRQPPVRTPGAMPSSPSHPLKPNLPRPSPEEMQKFLYSRQQYLARAGAALQQQQQAAQITRTGPDDAQSNGTPVKSSPQGQGINGNNMPAPNPGALQALLQGTPAQQAQAQALLAAYQQQARRAQKQVQSQYQNIIDGRVERDFLLMLTL